MRDVAGAVAKGVSFVCATCDKFWWGVQHGLDGCKASHEGKSCAGPVRGMSYPEYEGPLKGNLKRFCYATGKEPTMVMRMPDGGEVGSTERGLEIVMSYSEGRVKPRFITGEKPDLKDG